MPRPTFAQLAYGSATVVLSTLAMLLLSQTSAGPWVAVIAVAALALGLLVAVTLPAPGAATRRPALPRRRRARAAVTSAVAAPSTVVRTVEGASTGVPAAHTLHK